MKKLIAGLMLLAGIANASCFGPFCWDESGTGTVGNLAVTTLNAGLLTKTVAQMDTYSAGAAGQLIYVSNAVNYTVCVSTGTGAGAFVSVSVSTGSQSATATHCR